jgi:hypothetical protein
MGDAGDLFDEKGILKVPRRANFSPIFATSFARWIETNGCASTKKAV